ncbi:hypothetical protein [Neptunicella sp. SCSIO 80796]|uniref:hypothetical protein n=1 Tax=Neptunicella plasticusilytica TaxID=3117012 RepID=UPI003A4DC57B
MANFRWSRAVILLVLSGLAYDSSREPAALIDNIHNARQGSNTNSNWALLAETEQGEGAALAYLTRTNSIHWLGIAANMGYPAAQYRLAVLHPDAEIRQYWLYKAAAKGVAAAQQDLYWQLVDTDPKQALSWLQRAAQQDAASALILASLEWQTGNYAEARKNIERAQQRGSQQADLFLQALDDNQQPVAHSPLCRQQLLPVTTSLTGLLQAYQFKKQFSLDKTLANLPVCFANTRIFTDTQLQCGENWNDLPRLGCDEDFLARQLQDDDFTHLVVFSSQGKANVNNGIMYLDQHDTYQVFVHELAHFAGFVDEYPLSTALAQQVCSLDNQLPNLVIKDVKKTQTPTLPNRWQDVSPAQMVKARTCDNTRFQAYKPVSDFTFMEFYDEGTVPGLYLSLWQQQLATSNGILPAYINLAQAAEQSGNRKLSAFWWQRYQDFQH